MILILIPSARVTGIVKDSKVGFSFVDVLELAVSMKALSPSVIRCLFTDIII